MAANKVNQNHSFCAFSCFKFIHKFSAKAILVNPFVVQRRNGGTLL